MIRALRLRRRRRNLQRSLDGVLYALAATRAQRAEYERRGYDYAAFALKDPIEFYKWEAARIADELESLS